MEEEDIINKDYYKEFGEDTYMICSICKNIIIDPQVCSKCQNSFCKQCITIWRNQKAECPFRCPNSEIHSNRLLLKVLTKLKFKCRNCNQEFEYSKAQEHYSLECPTIKIDQSLILKEIKSLKKENKELKDLISGHYTETEGLEKEINDLKLTIVMLKEDNLEMKNLIQAFLFLLKCQGSLSLINAQSFSAQPEPGQIRWVCRDCYNELGKPAKFTYQASPDKKYEGYYDPNFRLAWSLTSWAEARCDKCKKGINVNPNNVNPPNNSQNPENNQNQNPSSGNQQLNFKWICNNCYKDLGKPMGYVHDRSFFQKFEGYYRQDLGIEWNSLNWNEVSCEQCKEKMLVNNYRWICKDCFAHIDNPDKFKAINGEKENKKYDLYLNAAYQTQWDKAGSVDAICEKCKKSVLN